MQIYDDIIKMSKTVTVDKVGFINCSFSTEAKQFGHRVHLFTLLFDVRKRIKHFIFNKILSGDDKFGNFFDN